MLLFAACCALIMTDCLPSMASCLGFWCFVTGLNAVTESQGSGAAQQAEAMSHDKSDTSSFRPTTGDADGSETSLMQDWLNAAMNKQTGLKVYVRQGDGQALIEHQTYLLGELGRGGEGSVWKVLEFTNPISSAQTSSITGFALKIPRADVLQAGHVGQRHWEQLISKRLFTACYCHHDHGRPRTSP